MIQLSYTLLGDVPTPAPAAPLTLEAVSDGARLTGVWPHRDLYAARRQLAAYLAGVAPERRMRENFTGREKDAASWAAELAVQPSITAVFEARHAIVEGRLFARLFGLYQLGESDLVLVADGAVDVAEVYGFLSAWASFRLASREEPQWDRPFPYGYWLVSTAESEVGDADFWALLRDSLGTQHLKHAFDARMSAPAPRLVIEAADPSDPDTDYHVGAGAALSAMARQRATQERLGAGAVVSASAQDAAGFCDRVMVRFDAREATPFFAYREAARGPLDSGWRFGCLDATHVHDTASLRIAPLGRARVAGLADYLGLPTGWVVTWEEEAFWITAPGEGKSHRDDGRGQPSGPSDDGAS